MMAVVELPGPSISAETHHTLLFLLRQSLCHLAKPPLKLSNVSAVETVGREWLNPVDVFLQLLVLLYP
ncbi:unnamed protein product [Lampetra fluviatilis]